MANFYPERGVLDWRGLGYGIYAFDDHDKGAPDLQDESQCTSGLETIIHFADSEKLDICSAAAGALSERSERDDVHALWLGEYGCVALFFKSLGSAAQESYHIYLIGLDKWVFDVHCSEAVGRQWTSASEDFVELYVGSLPVSQHMDFLSSFKMVLGKIQSVRRGDNRSAAHNEQGHQRTPAFVWALMRDVLAAVESGRPDLASEAEAEAGTTLPPGGLTDVGLHTGGKARNTCWALVRAAVETVMLHIGGEGAYGPQLWLRFDVWFMEGYVAALQPTKKLDAYDVNAVMRVLQGAVRGLAALADLGHDVSTLQHRCEALKAKLLGLANKAAEATALHYTLQDYATERPQLRDVTISGLPDASSTSVSGTGLETARKLASKNLGDVELPPSNFKIASAATILSWLREGKHESSEARQLVLTTVEQWAYAAMGRLQPLPNGPTSTRTAGAEASQVVDVLDVYRQTLHAFREAEGGREGQARGLVELRSREMLVVWVVFCLVHHDCKCTYTALAAMLGVPIRWKDLRHLCLEEREAWEAVGRVRGYLEANTVDGSELFMLSKPGATLRFGEAFARQDEMMGAVLQAEKADAEERRKKYWADVKVKQELVARLSRELVEVQQRRSTLVQKLADLRHKLNYGGHPDPTAGRKEEGQTQREINAAATQEDQKRRELQVAGTAPATVFQPLPEKDGPAYSTIFMLGMPPKLRLLARLSVLAQHMLLPPQVLARIRVSNPTAQVPSYVTTKAAGTRIKCPDPLPIILGNTASCVPDRVGPWRVVDITSECHNIWHPDSLLHASTVCLLWNSDGSRHGAFGNLFRLQDDEAFATLISDDFTARLPKGCEGLQWAMLQPGTQRVGPTRSNEALARQDERPRWLSKPQHLAFASLRAYPLLQLPRLTGALLDHSLPLGHAAVRLLLQQTLYQLGDLCPSSARGGGLEWKREWLDEGSTGLQGLHVALAGLADQLRNTPRESAALRTVAQIASSASQWRPDIRSTVCRILAEAVGRFAHECEAQIEAVATQSSLVSALRTRQCRFYLLGMLCHACHTEGALGQEDAIDMCRLMVLINHARIFEQQSAEQEEVRELSVLATHSLARVIGRLTSVVDSQPSCLTGLAGLVVQGLPEGLEWRRLAEQSACYEAEGEQGLYSINLLTGVVLLNGLPPRRLPVTVLNHPLYRRVFRGRSFETVLSGGQVMRTLRAVKGALYEFQDDVAQKRLVVKEVTPASETIEGEQGVTLELLDWAGEWCKDLPVRLRELHGHWYWRDKGVILLRGVSFLDRSVSFIVVRITHNGEHTWRCLRVPSHLREAGARAILQAYDQGVAGFERLGYLTTHPEVSRVFGRLEDGAFIHWFAHGGGSSLALGKVLLPRFGLEYELRDDGRFWSSDFGGDFCMSRRQHLTDTLRGYKGYLLLEHRTTGVVKLIVPRGHVQRKPESGQVVVQLAKSPSNQARDVHYYDMHPRLLHLQSPTISAHLHLACLYAACSTRLPEPRRHMTGAQVAMELVRQCFVTRPLHVSDELPSVRALQTSLSHACPALTLLAYELERSSMQHAPLYAGTGGSDGDEGGTVGPAATSLPDPTAVTAYLCHDVHLRNALTPEEEQRLLGRCHHHRHSSGGRVMPQDGSLEVKEQYCQVPFDAVVRHEKGLMALLRFDPSTDMEAGLPLNTELLKATKLGQQMVEQLEKSLLAYQRLPKPSLVSPLPTIAADLRARAKQVEDMRTRLESFVLKGLTTLPGKESTHDWHAVGFALLRVGELRPMPCLHDLLYLALDPSHARRLNPFLSQRSCVALRKCSVLWLSLCVLEDQLQRLCQHCNAGDEAALKQELQAHRNWEAEQRVEWLVYEVENRLKVRPMQATVAELLVRNIQQQEAGEADTGRVVQMNMGEGKTRVILPLLLLHPQRGKRLLRLHFLSQLLGDALDHLHAQLCRSVLHRKVGLLPFHRHTQLSPNQARVLEASLAHLQRSGGALCIAPEHRLSMALKILELRQQTKGSAEPSNPSMGLQGLLNGVAYVDVLDECDELLRHKYQLIYALGSKEALPSGHLRWHAVQALCRIIKTHGRSTTTELGRLLADPQVAVWEGGKRASEAFPKLRLARGQALEEVKARLTLALATQLLDDPPYEFEWLARDAWVEGHRERVLRWVSERQAEVDEEMEAALGGEESHRVQALLGLRGLLAFGLFFHVLQMRHRVDYGIKEGGPKSLAVPYRAADTPAERAEYSQADVSLCCTMLSHYYDGLSEEQTLQAFRALLQHGRSAQADLYASWLRLSRPSMSDDEAACVDSALKLDLSNALQRSLLVRHFRRNMETVNLYLSQLVLPRETAQFPQRLVANAWHLCANPIRPIGFSGTDDNNLLLPLQVQALDTHADEDLRELAATNGRMLCLLEGNPEVALLAEGSEGPLWRRVLDEAVNRQVDALIDAGGLVAGISYVEAAHYALTHKACRHKAVVFWDQATREWAMVDAKGRRWALGGSPIRERDALVLFDDSHCRGADMRLAPTARALLTLGPRMHKDKLMQAAGRMRRLQSGQALVLLATHDVARQVRTANGYPPSDQRPLTTTHVLQWASGNSVAANREGLAEFAKQGLLFAHTCGAPDGALLEEVLRLRDLYGAPMTEEPLVAVVQRLQAGLATKRPALSEEMRQLERQLQRHVTAYGGDCVVSATGLDEECERELELEVEQEEEREVQLPRMHPRSEQDWPYKDALAICQEAWPLVGPHEYGDKLGTLLARHVKATEPGEDLKNIQWGPRVYATHNFLLTVQDERGATPSSLAEYLRPVSFFLCFKADGTVLLLSEREADAIQAIIHDRPPRGPALPYELFDLTTCRLARANPLTFAQLGRTCSHASLSVDALVSLQLLDGDTTFKSAEQKSALNRAVGGVGSSNPDAMETEASTGGGKRAALVLPRLRGKHGDILRSDLERACM